MKAYQIRKLAASLALLLLVLGTSRVFAAFQDTQSVLVNSQPALESTVVPTDVPTEVPTVAPAADVEADETEIDDDMDEEDVVVDATGGQVQGPEIEEDVEDGAEFDDDSSSAALPGVTAPAAANGQAVNHEKIREPKSSPSGAPQAQHSSGGEDEHESGGDD